MLNRIDYFYYRQVIGVSRSQIPAKKAENNSSNHRPYYAH